MIRNVPSMGNIMKYLKHTRVVKKTKFTELIQDITIHDLSKSIRSSSAEDGGIHYIVHKNIRYKSYMTKRWQFW